MGKRKTNIESSRPDLALVPITVRPEKIPRRSRDKKAYITTYSNMCDIDTSAGLSRQVSILENVKETAELSVLFSSRSELQSLLATELRNVDNFALKENNDANY